MPITLNGDGTIQGMVVGGLPDGTIQAADLANNSVSTASIQDDAIVRTKLTASERMPDVKFSACLSTSHDNVTGDGTGWWTNTSGTYLFSFHSWIGGILSTHTEAYGYFETSNRNYEAYHGNPYASYVVSNSSQSFNWQTIADMDVGDTCKCKMGIYNGTKVCDMKGNGGFNYTSTVFQGVLLA